jgi:hypothetical protein
MALQRASCEQHHWSHPSVQVPGGEFMLTVANHALFLVAIELCHIKKYKDGYHLMEGHNNQPKVP